MDWLKAGTAVLGAASSIFGSGGGGTGDGPSRMEQTANSAQKAAQDAIASAKDIGTLNRGQQGKQPGRVFSANTMPPGFAALINSSPGSIQATILRNAVANANLSGKVGGRAISPVSTARNSTTPV
jgi:hypothetical protein